METENKAADTLAQQCRAAITALERAHTAPPPQFTQETDAALRSAAAVRDGLIARLRGGDTAVRAALEPVNVALSIIAGLQYPAAGITRENTKHASDALEQALGYLKDP